MRLTKLTLLLAIGIVPLFGQAQESRISPENWFNLDFKADSVMGISTEKAYTELLKGRKPSTVITAVIDGGVDIHHEDLRDVLWINKKDASNSGKDEDHNGYINDKYGWSFIGNPSGENVHYDNLEVTRLVRELAPKYADKVPTSLMSPTEHKEFIHYNQALRAYNQKLEDANYGQLNYSSLIAKVDTIAQKVGKSIETIQLSDFESFDPQDSKDRLALQIIYKGVEEEGTFDKFYNQLKEAKNYYSNQVNYHLNQEFDPRNIVGDDYENASERFYGNNDVKGADAEHGTHVAGIIGANRFNDLGIKGVADAVQIMSLRVVPDGDERDKDVANAIRYAADNGAKVINMSFGKAFSKNKQIVDEAVKYAISKDVLLVQAAGNDGQNLDTHPSFPNKFFTDSLGYTIGEAEPWITVGATRWELNDELVANFSNYGLKSVDVFAPGVRIYSALPESTYKEMDGTSMASPVVAGLASLIRSYYPEFTALETKQVIMASVTKIDEKVKISADDRSTQEVFLDEISVSGGIVNAYQAIIEADKLRMSKK